MMQKRKSNKHHWVGGANVSCNRMRTGLSSGVVACEQCLLLALQQTWQDGRRFNQAAKVGKTSVATHLHELP